MVEIRCKACDKFYGKASVFVGVIKCSRCKMVFEYAIYSNLVEPSKTLYKKHDSGNITPETTESEAPQGVVNR